MFDSYSTTTLYLLTVIFLGETFQKIDFNDYNNLMIFCSKEFMIVSCSSFSHVGWSNYETKLAAHFDTQSSAIFPPLVLYVVDYFELKHILGKVLPTFKKLNRMCPIYRMISSFMFKNNW